MYAAFVVALLAWAAFVGLVFDFRKQPVPYVPPELFVPEASAPEPDPEPAPIPTAPKAKQKITPKENLNTPSPTIKDDSALAVFDNDALIRELAEKNKNNFPMNTQTPPETNEELPPAASEPKQVTTDELPAGVVWRWNPDNSVSITITGVQAGDEITLTFDGYNTIRTVDSDSIRGRDRNYDMPPRPVQEGQEYPFLVKIQRNNHYTLQQFTAEK